MDNETVQEENRCIEEGCEEKAEEGEKELNTHDGPAIDHVVKTTESEIYQYRALDAEMRNHLQAISITDLKITEARLKYNETVTKLQAEKKGFINLFEVAQIAYNNFIKELAEKYDLDPKKMAIHPDTRVVEDLREQTDSS